MRELRDRPLVRLEEDPRRHDGAGGRPRRAARPGLRGLRRGVQPVAARWRRSSRSSCCRRSARNGRRRAWSASCSCCGRRCCRGGSGGRPRSGCGSARAPDPGWPNRAHLGGLGRGRGARDGTPPMERASGRSAAQRLPTLTGRRHRVGREPRRARRAVADRPRRHRAASPGSRRSRYVVLLTTCMVGRFPETRVSTCATGSSTMAARHDDGRLAGWRRTNGRGAETSTAPPTSQTTS